MIVADWPEDIAQFNMLLLTGPGLMVDAAGDVPARRLEDFSTAATAPCRTMRCTMRARFATTWSEANEGYSAA